MNHQHLRGLGPGSSQRPQPGAPAPLQLHRRRSQVASGNSSRATLGIDSQPIKRSLPEGRFEDLVQPHRVTRRSRAIHPRRGLLATHGGAHADRATVSCAGGPRVFASNNNSALDRYLAGRQELPPVAGITEPGRPTTCTSIPSALELLRRDHAHIGAERLERLDVSFYI